MIFFLKKLNIISGDQNIVLAKSSVRVDVVAMPNMTIKELKSLDQSVPKEETKGEEKDDGNNNSLNSFVSSDPIKDVIGNNKPNNDHSLHQKLSPKSSLKPNKLTLTTNTPPSPSITLRSRSSSANPVKTI